MASREDLVFLAKLAGKTKRYDEMVEAMSSVAKLNTDLSMEERSLLSTAHADVVAAKRKTLHKLASVELAERKRNDSNANKVRMYIHKIETELTKICLNQIDIIDRYLIPFCPCAENLVFYYKMKGVSYKELAQFKIGHEKKEFSDLSLEAYEIASKATKTYLTSTNPVRLVLALNISVLYDEILSSPKRSFEVAKQAFDGAVSELHSSNEQSNRHGRLTKLMMQFLKYRLAQLNSVISDHAGFNARSKKKAVSGESSDGNLSPLKMEVSGESSDENLSPTKMEVSGEPLDENLSPIPICPNAESEKMILSCESLDGSLCPTKMEASDGPLDENLSPTPISTEADSVVDERQNDATEHTYSSPSEGEEERYKQACEIGKLRVRRVVVRTGGRSSKVSPTCLVV